jgi:hypothetical protein
VADRTPDLSGYMHDGKFWARTPQQWTRADQRNPCYLCGWGPTRGIHSVPPGTEPHGEIGLHSFRSRGPKLEDATGVLGTPEASDETSNGDTK